MNDGFDEAMCSPAQLAESERGTRVRAMLKGPLVPVAASPASAVGATSIPEVGR